MTHAGYGKYIYVSEMHQNAANLGLQTYEENQWTFLWHRTGVDFGSLNNFAEVSLQKFPFL